MIKRITYEVDDAFCDKCGEDLKSYLGYGYIADDDNQHHYCYDCALKLGIITAMDWLLGHGICIYDKATYSSGVITAYRKWGRGYKVDTERIFKDV